MISITETIFLEPITLSAHKELFTLMKRIYPPAYAHFWKDDCSWYLHKLYSKENLELELKQKNGVYYFVRFRESINHPLTTIGIFKLISDCTYTPLSKYRAFKIHRIYLDSFLQGKGIGKILMQYAINTALETQHDLIWLDAMDKHQQAQGFYGNIGFEKTELQSLDLDLLHEEYRPMWYMHKMLT